VPFLDVLTTPRLDLVVGDNYLGRSTCSKRDGLTRLALA